jgi:hypothetical protein
MSDGPPIEKQPRFRRLAEYLAGKAAQGSCPAINTSTRRRSPVYPPV